LFYINLDVNFPNLQSEFEKLKSPGLQNFLKSFFHFLTHIFDEKKSARIHLKITPIAWTTSRVGQIWPQIVFLFFSPP